MVDCHTAADLALDMEGMSHSDCTDWDLDIAAPEDSTGPVDHSTVGSANLGSAHCILVVEDTDCSSASVHLGMMEVVHQVLGCHIVVICVGRYHLLRNSLVGWIEVCRVGTGRSRNCEDRQTLQKLWFTDF